MQSADWIQNQCNFLSRYALASLQAQTDGNFEWLVSASAQLSEESLDLLRESISPVGKLVLQQGDTHSSDVFASILSESDGQYLTVLFDYDDFLHPTFVEQVRALCDQEHSVFSFVSGVAYDLDACIAAWWPHVSNPFLVARGESGVNIFSWGNHTQVERKAGTNMKVISTAGPMWLKLVHGSNLGEDKITALDKPIFGNFVQRHFTGGKFPIHFVPNRDVRRVIEHGFFLFKRLILRTLHRGIGS